MDPQKAVYYVGIRNKPDALKVLRTVFSDRLGSERSEGDATFLKVSLGGSQNDTGTAQWNFYHLAVTPSFVIASSRAETLREFLAKRPPAAAAPQATLPPAFQSARAQFPAMLNGLAFMSPPFPRRRLLERFQRHPLRRMARIIFGLRRSCLP
jgi:hypothetical protein